MVMLDRIRSNLPMRSGKIAVAVGGLVILVLAYFPLAMILADQINDDVDFRPREELLPPEGSRAVATAVALIEREVDLGTWAANKPFPLPHALIDNMPNFQTGLVYAISRFAIEMTDVLGRTRGSGQVDEDLDKASGLLKYDGTVWVWDPSTSLLPTASAERQYLAAMKALIRYNERLSLGSAVYDRRADNLIAFIERVSSDLGSSSAVLDRQALESNAGWFDTQADDIFYATKGRLYGYYLLLEAIGVDFAAVIVDKNIGLVWQQMLDNLKTAATLDPLLISNGRNSGFLLPSHLTTQGFYLLRARTQLKEVANVLLK